MVSRETLKMVPPVRFASGCPVKRSLPVRFARKACAHPLSVDLTNLQIRHYAHLVRLDIYDPLRQVTLHADTDAKPPNWKGRRPSGAPPKAWVTEAAARTRETYRLSAPHTPFSAQEYHDFLRNALAVRQATNTRRELARTACQHSTTLQDILSLASTRTASLSKPDTDSTKLIDHTNRQSLMSL